MIGEALKLDAEQPFEHLSFRELGFVPEVITFLDVLEHFEGDLKSRLLPWLRALPPTVRHVVIKVPIREGLLFSIAGAARRAGVESLGNQLFQCGTFPPHFQYFTRRSLEAFVALTRDPSALLELEPRLSPPATAGPSSACIDRASAGARTTCTRCGGRS